MLRIPVQCQSYLLMTKLFSNIPIFIPGLACPFQCVFCDQKLITQQCKPPEEHTIHNTINSYLSTLLEKKVDKRIQIAFFGGSFTGLGTELQNYYLDLVQPYIRSGDVEGIRISTRPDYISCEILENLQYRNVKAIELGAQSMDDHVLAISGRGHKATHTVRAAKMIKTMGFELGMQMMIGLPGDSDPIATNTAQKIIDLGAETTRIYPTLVLEGTELSSMYKDNLYTPLSLEHSINLSARLAIMFSDAGVEVLRIGLHLSQSSDRESSDILAGPVHPAYGELVLTKIWYEKLSRSIVKEGVDSIVVYVSPADLNAAIGHKGYNKKFLMQHFSHVLYKSDSSLSRFSFYVDYN